MNIRWRPATALLLACIVLGMAAPALGQGELPGAPHQQMPDRSISPGAHARYSKASINMDAPNLALTVALVDAGGGASAFDAGKLLGNLTGNGAAEQTELAGLTKKFGAANVTSFETTFGFVTNDALAQVAKTGIALPTTPAPVPTDAKALAGALFTAGVMPGGKFDVEYMLDTLVSHVVHIQVMNDIDANPELGPAADANYHLVLAQVMMDLKKTYEL